ncbi:MAG: leucyl aminopeptidase family protein [Brevundimonas sp.]|uniref:leucyl aminopeptidase family protein n=1 Tax=Brevundimonas sp. TaxID=1871086 RepID=UPI0039190201
MNTSPHAPIPELVSALADDFDTGLVDADHMARADQAVPLHPVRPDDLDGLDARTRDLARTRGFSARPGEILEVCGEDGLPARVLFGLPADGAAGGPLASARSLSTRLSPGTYRLEGATRDQAGAIALGFALGHYRFDAFRRTRPESSPRAALLIEDAALLSETRTIARACAIARQMVDAPPNHMGPAEIEAAARAIAGQHGADISVVTGDALLEQNYPAVHAVGRAATPARAPRIIEMHWNANASDLPLLALVGKGVVFDSGGLDIKPAAGMRNMKKDMGGAAHALALAWLVMTLRLKVRLVVLVPAVENAISGESFRPGDIIGTRKGLSVEIGNTDAEGRVILSDALARADELSPDLTLDFATLTGAARIALGPELVPLYSDDEALAQGLIEAGREVADPLWRMPLWPGYRSAIEPDIADLRNDSADWAQAGSVMAALFLQRFAPERGWAHMDIFAWNPRARPGHPAGAEAQGLRACALMLMQRFGQY